MVNGTLQHHIYVLGSTVCYPDWIFLWLFSLPLADTGVVPQITSWLHPSTFSPIPLLTVGHAVWDLDRSIKWTINK